MDQLELMKQQLDLVRKEQEVMTKSCGMEFERVANAFGKMGNLLDLLYLETSVMIEFLAEKGIFTQEEFSKRLEETAKKVEEQIKKAAEETKAAAETPPIVKL